MEEIDYKERYEKLCKAIHDQSNEFKRAFQTDIYDPVGSTVLAAVYVYEKIVNESEEV